MCLVFTVYLIFYYPARNSQDCFLAFVTIYHILLQFTSGLSGVQHDFLFKLSAQIKRGARFH